MPRRKSFSSIIRQASRESARAQRQLEAEQKRREREYAKAITAAQKLAKEEYLATRIEEVENINSEIKKWLQDIQHILPSALNKKNIVEFDSLRIKRSFPSYKIPKDLKDSKSAPKLQRPDAPPDWISNLFPCVKRRYIDALKKADLEYQGKKREFERLEKERVSKLQESKAKYQREKQDFLLKVETRNSEVDELEDAYAKGEPSAVNAYNELILERSEYPSIREYPFLSEEYGSEVKFPRNFKVAYVENSKQLVIDYELPQINIIPNISEVKYIKSKDEIQRKERKASDVKLDYQDIIASISLKTIYEIFKSDQSNLIEVVVFSGFVEAVDRATGKDIQPYLISLRVIRSRFDELDLSRVDKRVCLRNLGAQLSARPEEMQAVKPIIEFSMVDPRFIEQEGDILSELESRPNLMELNPQEFEGFVAALFEQMGFETKLTRSSRDGGVDAVAFDKRPIVGGKVVIQAKRYRNTVGVSAVRDLYGTMMNEGANKGILVATSGYGPDAFDFSKDKPIELIDGSGLLYLLEEHTGIKARIIMPEF